MARNSIPTYTTGDLITAAHGNTYWRDNEAAHWAILAKKNVQLEPFSARESEALEVGDGAAYFTVPAELNGWELTAVHAAVLVPPSGGTVSIQIHNATDSHDMLSTPLTIDDGEVGSNTAAAAAVINTAYDDLDTYDILRIDVDAVNGAEGLIITLTFSEA